MEKANTCLKLCFQSNFLKNLLGSMSGFKPVIYLHHEHKKVDAVGDHEVSYLMCLFLCKSF